MKLFIIRHGDPDYANDCLTPLGKRQAEALGRRFANTDLDMVFISPLGRAQETAKPTCEIKKLHAEILDWTSENAIYEELMVPEGNTSRWCFAQQNTNYTNYETIRYYDNWQKAHPDFDRVSVRAGMERIGTESDAFLKKLGYERQGAVYKILEPSEKSVAVFCHQGFGLSWYAHLMQLPPHLVWAGFDVAHTGVTLFHFENYENGITTPKCLMLSDLSHIYQAGLPMRYENRLKI